MVALSSLLLIGFLAAFFWFEPLIQALVGTQIVSVAGDNLVLANISGFQISVSQSALYTFLGGGVVFFEFIIVIMSMFDRVLDTLKIIIRPIMILIPLVAFAFSVYNTFNPIVRSLLPTEIVGASTDFTATINQAEFSKNVTLTFATMMLYLLFSRLLRTDSAEVRALKSELQKIKKGPK